MTNRGVLETLAELINQRRPIEIARYFTEEFRLDDAGTGIVRTGHTGAREMIDDMLALSPNVHYEMLDIVEQENRLAVRWRVIGSKKTGSFDVAMIAFYRFVEGRIAEDWGLWNGKSWGSRPHH